jgi:hypothetical protein
MSYGRKMANYDLGVMWEEWHAFFHRWFPAKEYKTLYFFFYTRCPFHDMQPRMAVPSNLTLVLTAYWTTTWLDSPHLHCIISHFPKLVNLSLDMEMVYSSKVLLNTYQTTRYHNLEDNNKTSLPLEPQIFIEKFWALLIVLRLEHKVWRWWSYTTYTCR